MGGQQCASLILLNLNKDIWISYYRYCYSLSFSNKSGRTFVIITTYTSFFTQTFALDAAIFPLAVVSIWCCCHLMSFDIAFVSSAEHVVGSSCHLTGIRTERCFRSQCLGGIRLP